MAMGLNIVTIMVIYLGKKIVILLIKRTGKFADQQRRAHNRINMISKSNNCPVSSA